MTTERYLMSKKGNSPKESLHYASTPTLFYEENRRNSFNHQQNTLPQGNLPRGIYNKTVYEKKKYRKVMSYNTSGLEAHAGFFILLMKEIFDPYVLGLFDKKLIF